MSETGANTTSSISQATELARFFWERGFTRGIVLVTDDPESARAFPSEVPLFVVSLSENELDNDFLSLPSNCRRITLRGLDQAFLEDKILVCSTPFEDTSSRSSRTKWKRLRALASNARLSILPEEQERRGNARRIRRVPQVDEGVMSGHSVLLRGRAVDIHLANFPPVSVLAFIPMYNERDIIDYTVRYLLGQGVDVRVLDNWSTDGSYEVVSELSAQHPDRVSVERFPERPSENYLYRDVLRHIAGLANSSFSRYQWVALISADELRRSAWLDVTLQQAISFVDSLGYNCIDYTLFNFLPTEDGFDEGNDPSAFFRYGEFATEPWAFSQLNTWKNVGEVDISTHGGHLVLMDENRIFPLKFLLQHYSLRSNRQARRKIFQERLPRYAPDELEMGWHVQYDGVREDQSFLRDPSELIEFRLPAFYTDYLIERISGIGIQRDL